MHSVRNGRIVLDTNVLVSATFWNGASFSVVRMIEQTELQLLLSPHIIKEYDRTMISEEISVKRAKHGLSPLAVVQHLLRNAVLVEPNEIHRICEDPDDDHVLAGAIEGKASYLVTQDKHLLKIQMYDGVHILTPEEFLARKHF